MGILSIVLSKVSEGSVILLVLFVIIAINQAKKEIDKRLRERDDKLMFKDTCEAQRKADSQRHDDLVGHLNSRFEDMKTFIKQNGFHK